MLFMKRRRVILLVLSFVLLLVAAVPYGSGKANAARTGVGSGIVKIASASDHSLALKGDGTVVSWGYNGGAGQMNVPAGLTGVVAISAAGQR